MIDLDRRTELDVELHDLMMAEGMGAFMGHYTAPGATADVAVRVYVHLDVLRRGEFGQLVGRRDELQILRPEGVALRNNGEVFIENADKTGGTTFVLGEIQEDDGSVSRWVVRRV